MKSLVMIGDSNLKGGIPLPCPHSDCTHCGSRR